MANHLWSGGRIIGAAHGDDQGIWASDIVALHDDIQKVFDDREKSYFYNRICYNPVWHYHSSFAYMYCVINSDHTAFPVCLPVGSEIRETGAVVTGANGSTAGDIYLNEYQIGGTLVTAHDISGVANPWDTGGVAFGNAVTYTQTVAHADLPMVIKPMHYYFFMLESGSNAATHECRLWNIWLKTADCDH
jgi:hypothetical protein